MCAFAIPRTRSLIMLFSVKCSLLQCGGGCLQHVIFAITQDTLSRVNGGSERGGGGVGGADIDGRIRVLVT